MPLQTILGVSRSSPEYRSEKLAGAFYAQSWLMLHFYTFGNRERRVQIDKYLKLIGERARPQTAFAEAFAGDRGEFEKELQQYARRSRLGYLQISVPDVGKNIESVVTELPAAAASEALAAWMLRHRPLDDADVKFLEQQAKEADLSSTASLQLALAYLKKDKADLAKPRLNAGCATPATAVRPAIVCGNAYMLLNASNESATSGSDEGMLLARQFFMAALQIEPHNVEALTLAAYTYRSLGGDAQSLVEALEKSLARDPNNPALVISLATVLQHSDPVKTRDYLERAILNVADAGQLHDLIQWLERVEQQIAATKDAAG